MVIPGKKKPVQQKINKSSLLHTPIPQKGERLPYLFPPSSLRPVPLAPLAPAEVKKVDQPRRRTSSTSMSGAYARIRWRCLGPALIVRSKTIRANGSSTTAETSILLSVPRAKLQPLLSLASAQVLLRRRIG